MPGIVRAQEKSLKVGVYGGYFKDSFDKHVFPEFTKATASPSKSVAEPTGEAWLVQLDQAARAGAAPADVSMMSQVAMLKGQSTELWAPIDMGKLKTRRNLKEQFINKYPDGRVAGVGAVSCTSRWCRTPTSSRSAGPPGPRCGEADKADKLGLLALVSNSFLLEVTATTFFGGPRRSTTRRASSRRWRSSRS